MALSRSLRFLLCGAILILEFADRSHAQGQESTIFPGTGHTYLVDFSAFRVELVFTSATSLTYTGISPDGTLSSFIHLKCGFIAKPMRSHH